MPHHVRYTHIFHVLEVALPRLPRAITQPLRSLAPRVPVTRSHDRGESEVGVVGRDHALAVGLV